MVTKRGALALLMALMAGAYALAFTPVETGNIGAMFNELISRLVYRAVIPIVATILAVYILAKVLERHLSKRRSRRSGQMQCTCYCG